MNQNGGPLRGLQWTGRLVPFLKRCVKLGNRNYCKSSSEAVFREMSAIWRKKCHLIMRIFMSSIDIYHLLYVPTLPKAP